MALTTSSSTSQTAYEPGAPGTSVPATPSRTPPARHAPRVAAANAARGEMPLPAVRCWAAARTAAHGSSAVTGASEPSASDTPAAASCANGFIAAARSLPRRRAYSPSGPPQAASKPG